MISCNRKSLLSFTIMFNLVNGASVATRDNISKKIQQLSDISDFSSLDLSKIEEDLIQILKEGSIAIRIAFSLSVCP